MFVLNLFQGFHFVISFANLSFFFILKPDKIFWTLSFHCIFFKDNSKLQNSINDILCHEEGTICYIFILFSEGKILINKLFFLNQRKYYLLVEEESEPQNCPLITLQIDIKTCHIQIKNANKIWIVQQQLLALGPAG